MPALASVARTVSRAVGLASKRTAAVAFDLVPASLRASDPAFLMEFEDGQFGLAAGPYRRGKDNPFDNGPAPDAVLRELYGWSWLRHLETARTETSEAVARQLLLDWRRSAAHRSALAQDHAVLARRAVSLLAHADAGLAGADRGAYDKIMGLVVETFEDLTYALPRMPLSLPRATTAIALTAYYLCRGDVAERIAAERRLAAELTRQILPDGGHISRNPAALLDLVLDLLPLRRLYVTSRLTVPPALQDALTRARNMLRFLLHTDQQLARLNGMGATPQAELSAVLLQLQAISVAPLAFEPHARASGYVRIDAGPSVLIIDAGAPPETLPGDSPFAGTLAFEFSSGRAPLISHPGNDAAWLAPASPAIRATAAHATLTLADTSSTPLSGGRSGVSEAKIEPREGHDAAHAVTLRSTSYRERLGHIHVRKLMLSWDGRSLEGVDTLEATVSPGADHPYAVRFPLHPSVYVDTDPLGRGLRLVTSDGAIWRFTAEGAALTIEPVKAFAMAAGPRPSLQLVLSARTAASREVRWTFERATLPTIA